MALPQAHPRTCNVLTEPQATEYFEKLLELHSLILTRHATHTHHLIRAGNFDLTPGEHTLLLSIIATEKSWTRNTHFLTNPVEEGIALAELLFRHASKLSSNRERNYFVQTYFPLHFNFILKEISESNSAKMDMDIGMEERWVVANGKFYESAAQRWLELNTEWKMESLSIGEDVQFWEEESEPRIELQKWILDYARELWAIA